MPTTRATGERTQIWSRRCRATFCSARKSSIAPGTGASRGTRTITFGPGAVVICASSESSVSPGSTVMICSAVSTIPLLKAAFVFRLHLLQPLVLGQQPRFFFRQGGRRFRPNLPFAILPDLGSQRPRLGFQLLG